MTPDELKTARQQLGLSQSELARALKLGAHGDRTIRRWEAGDWPIPGPVEVAVQFLRVVRPQKSQS